MRRWLKASGGLKKGGSIMKKKLQVLVFAGIFTMVGVIIMTVAATA